MSGIGPFLPRRLSLFVSAIGGLAAAPAVLSARQLMTLSVGSTADLVVMHNAPSPRWSA